MQLLTLFVVSNVLLWNACSFNKYIWSDFFKRHPVFEYSIDNNMALASVCLNSLASNVLGYGLSVNSRREYLDPGVCLL